MECAQTAGIDLPLKALAWQDATGQVWLGYNDPKYLASRHGADNCGPVVENISKALGGMTQEAIRNVSSRPYASSTAMQRVNQRAGHMALMRTAFVHQF
ncbi:hypothetical protein G6F63_015036 [Rhizopus arrhizus]|nr:hypothetical protein G6F63_015036 [Rhizopus arrhizus]